MMDALPCENEEAKNDERPNTEENDLELLQPLVLIVENANFNKIFNVDPVVTSGVPFDKTKMQDTDVHSNQLPINEHKFHLCPHPTVRNLLGPFRVHPNFDHLCLFVTKFDSDEPKQCSERPRGAIVINKKYQGCTDPTRYGRFAVKLCYPVIKTDRTSKSYTSGIRKFFTKGFQESQVSFKPNYLNLYHFAYNEEEEITEWTMQMVIPMSTLWSFTPQPDEITLSESGRDVLRNSFDLLINTYKAQDKTKPYWLAHRLAQPTQYPFNIMTAATSEFINTAPLQNKLQPLIYLIEERIQKLSDYISKPLSIMTMPLYYEIDGYDKKLYLDENRKFLIPNVWSKQVYDETTNTGIVIIVHNYPEYVPSEGLLCKSEAYCNFQKWKTESSQFKDAFDESLIKYAYCCERAKFQMQLTAVIKEVIDINNF